MDLLRGRKEGKKGELNRNRTRAHSRTKDAATAGGGSKVVDLRVSLRRKDIDKGVRVTVKGDGRGGFEEFSVEGGEDSDDVVGACGPRKGREER